MRNLSLSMGLSIKNTGVNRALRSPKGGLLELFIFVIDDSFVKKKMNILHFYRFILL